MATTLRRQRECERKKLQRALYRLENPRPLRSNNKIKKNCLYCGAEFWVFPCLQRIECCSRACASQLKAVTFSRPMKRRKRLCRECSTEFESAQGKRCPSCALIRRREQAKLEMRSRWKDPAWIPRLRAYAKTACDNVQADPERRRRRNLRQRENEAKRRAQIKGTRVARISYERLVAMHGMWCYLCMKGIELGDLSFDHVIPLVRGGTHTEDNLRPAHTNCNRRKNRRLPEELQWR